MIAKSDLYDLIKSLTPSEKRYFKLHAKKHVLEGKKNNYERLFDALDKINEENGYEESKFKKDNRTKPFIKNFADEKKNLEEIILSVLRAYTNDKDNYLSIYDEIKDIEILKNKGLYEKAIKKIKLATKICTEYELYAEQLIINFIYQNILVVYSKDNSDLENSKQNNIILSKIKFIESIRIDNELLKKEIIQKSNENIENIIKNISNKQSLKSSEKYNAILYNIYSNYYLYKNDFNSLLEISINRLKNIQNKKYKIANYDGYVIPIISNLLYSLLRLERINQFPLYLDLLLKMNPKIKSNQILKTKTYINYELIYLLNVNNISRKSNQIPIINKYIYSCLNDFNQIEKINFLLNLSILNFLESKYNVCSDTLIMIYRAIKDSSIKQYPLKYCNIKILEIICHFESNNFLLIDSEIRNWERYLNKINSIPEFIKLIINVFKSILKNPFDTNYKELIIYFNVNENAIQPNWIQLVGIVNTWIQRK